MHSPPAHACLIAALSLLGRVERSVVVVAAAETDSFSGCDGAEYYAPLLGSDGVLVGSRSQLHDLLTETHRRVLPYTSDNEDVWDGLIDVDGRQTSGGSGSGTTNDEVRLVYSATTYVPALPHGTAETWNREHLWPKSAGVGKSGPDFTDLHHLRPSDWNVNAARSNKWFGPCDTAVPREGEAEGNEVDECRVPAHEQAAEDTETDSDTWLPPADVRGNIARALLYMDVRYDDENEYDLVLTDCPERAADDGQINELGYKSQLLEWHASDPVDDEERARNERVCERWQGNRNPFVDYPDLVEVLFGKPGTLLDGGGYAECAADGGGGGSGGGSGGSGSGASPTPAPMDAGNPPTPAAGGGGADIQGSCNGLGAGDVVVTAFGSDNPDVVALVALTGLRPGTEVYITDNAWTGTAFRTNEGAVKLTVPDGSGIRSGSVFFYGDTASSSEWQVVDGGFSLSASGDSIIVYCTEMPESPTDPSGIVFLSALTYTGAWMPENASDETAFGSEGSALPKDLLASSNSAVVTLPHKDNYWYVGARGGSRDEILASIGNPLKWEGSNSEVLDVDAAGASFVVITAEETSGATMAKATMQAALFGCLFLFRLML